MSRPATVRRPVAPRHPRRVSGPARPTQRPRAVAQPTTGRLTAVADHRFLDTLLRSRAWIWLIGVLLGGIVAMQVSLLKLNTGISRAVQSAATLERQNADLEADVARLASGERVRAAATKLGLVLPDAGTIRYLRARESDPGRALRRMTPPSAAAQSLMAAGGRSVAASPATNPAPVATVSPLPTATPAPTATPTMPPAAATGTTAP